MRGRERKGHLASFISPCETLLGEWKCRLFVDRKQPNDSECDPTESASCGDCLKRVYTHTIMS